jgi:RNA polymerase sigma-70 factor (ECF subfamily)
MPATALHRRTARPAPPGGGGVVAIGGADGPDSAELLRALHDQHSRAVWAYVVRLTNGDAALADDVVQETLLRAWRHPQVLDQSQGSARAWLMTVARRIVIDDWRSRGRRGEVVTADPPDQPVTDATDHTVDAMIVTAAMNRLSADHRAVLFECYHRGASVAEAALTLGVPPGTVKSRTHYALRALRAALQEMGGLT